MTEAPPSTAEPRATSARREGLAYRWSRVHPAGVIAVGLLLAGLGQLLFAWLDERDGGTARFFLTIIPCYLVVAAFAIRSSVRALDALSGLPERCREALRGEMARLPLRWLASAVLVGCAIHGAILTFLGFPLLRPPQGNLLVWVSGWIHAVLLGVVPALLLRQGFFFRQLGHEVRRVDLLDLASLAPFVQVALRLVLLSSFLLAVTLAFHLDWGTLRVAPQIVLVFPLLFTLQVLTFTIPLWGAHARMRAERAGEIARVDAAIRGDRDALRDTLLRAEAERVSTALLLLYRGQVEALSTWPFGTSALLRLLVYGGIPLLGWIASALVEHGVGVALGG